MSDEKSLSDFAKLAKKRSQHRVVKAVGTTNEDTTPKPPQAPQKPLNEVSTVQEPMPDLQQFEATFNERLQAWEKRMSGLLSQAAMRQSSGSSGGSVRILENDDVVFQKVGTVTENQMLAFDISTGKFRVRNPQDFEFVRIPVTTNTYTLSTADYATREAFLGVNNTANTTVTLDTGHTTGSKVYVKDESGRASINKIKIETTDNIDGKSSVTIGVDYGSLSLIYTGQEWSIV